VLVKVTLTQYNYILVVILFTVTFTGKSGNVVERREYSHQNLHTEKKTLLPQQNVLLIYPQQIRIVGVTILFVTVTTIIVVVAINIVVVTIDIVTTAILVCCGYINRTFC